MTLSRWLRDYLYISLGGNRGSELATYRNLMLTMVLGGLWHGAAWSYAIWGFWHGLMLAAERLTADLGWSLKGKLPKALHMLFIFTCVTLAWLLFKLPDFSHVVGYLKAMVNNWGGADLQPILLFFVALFSIPVVAYHLLHLWSRTPRPALQAVKPVLYGIMLFLILVNAGSGASFIYFQF